MAFWIGLFVLSCKDCDGDGRRVKNGMEWKWGMNVMTMENIKEERVLSNKCAPFFVISE